mmetsp:Transcript_14798/g.47178  ORF Transcript_14798/g.47178 Transcript_14798/m.47178 type:complete len:242 (+) Transcript_14798:411-1136(+)
MLASRSPWFTFCTLVADSQYSATTSPSSASAFASVAATDTGPGTRMSVCAYVSESRWCEFTRRSWLHSSSTFDRVVACTSRCTTSRPASSGMGGSQCTSSSVMRSRAAANIGSDSYSDIAPGTAPSAATVHGWATAGAPSALCSSPPSSTCASSAAAGVPCSSSSRACASRAKSSGGESGTAPCSSDPSSLASGLAANMPRSNMVRFCSCSTVRPAWFTRKCVVSLTTSLGRLVDRMPSKR